MACRAHPLTLVLRAGESVNASVTRALAQAGFASGYVHLEKVPVAPMRYVIPAPAPDGSHAAWYSDIFAPDGIVTIETAGLVAGERDGAPFVHCHGIWREDGDARRAGHLLPHDTILGAAVDVTAWGISGAAFIARDDGETNFKLFCPQEAEALAGAGARALACTIRPNGDIATAIETICHENGFADAVVHGVGSLVGVDFTDGRHVASYATEVFVTDGRVSSLTGTPHCTLDVGLVDMEGAVHEGRLVRGCNPVCVTFELLVVEHAQQ